MDSGWEGAPPSAEQEVLGGPLFQALFEHTPDGVLLAVVDGTILRANPAACAMLGRTEEEVRRAGRRGIAVDGPEVRRLLAERERGGAVRGELEFIRPDRSTFRADVTSVIVPATRGAPRSCVIFRDLEPQRRREEALRRRLHDQALQGRKLETLGRLAGGIAHDFNNLLTVVLSCSAALREDVAAGRPASAEEVEEIHGAGERGRDLTRQLLAFARRQVVAPVPLDLNALLRRSERLLRRLLGEDVALEVTPGPRPWRTRCDPGQLEQVILNLALNARDAMPAGGTLALGTSPLTVSPGGAAAAGAPEGEWVVLTVRDDGVGMSPEVRERIFEPFFTTKDPGRGTGLGLATVHGIVQQAGGWIQVESAPQRGTTFRIGLPRTLDAEPGTAVGAAAAPAAVAVAGGETALVVEDDPHVRGVTVRTLRASGYRVLEAADAAAALEVLGREPGFVHLLVTDVVLPGVGGRQLAEEVARRRPGIGVLLVSGYVREAEDERRINAAVTAYLAKPFTPEALLAAVRSALPPA